MQFVVDKGKGLAPPDGSRLSCGLGAVTIKMDVLRPMWPPQPDSFKGMLGGRLAQNDPVSQALISTPFLT